MTQKSKVLMLGTGGVSDAVRLILPARELDKKGYQVDIKSLGEFASEYQAVGAVKTLDIDYVACILSRPHNPDVIRALRDKRIKVIVDLDDDFHSIPQAHPGYRHVGPGNPDYLNAVAECVAIADHLTVTTWALRERWKSSQHEITIIPNGWSKDNSWWGKTYQRETLNLLWGGTITHREDFQMAIPALNWITNKHSHVRVVIAGDPLIYQMLKKVPERQKVFVPAIQYDDWPHTLSYGDILLAPLLDDDFNRHKSDIKLVDAGAEGIPFVASPVINYLNWGRGGLFVDNNQWQEGLDELVQSADTRQALARAGNDHAQEREMGKLIDFWESIL